LAAFHLPLAMPLLLVGEVSPLDGAATTGVDDVVVYLSALSRPAGSFGVLVANRTKMGYQPLEKVGERGWDRTIDPLIKSQLLYH
jgi:hypothetical protein